jgi:hypothetical protein
MVCANERMTREEYTECVMRRWGISPPTLSTARARTMVKACAELTHTHLEGRAMQRSDSGQGKCGVDPLTPGG